MTKWTEAANRTLARHGLDPIVAASRTTARQLIAEIHAAAADLGKEAKGLGKLRKVDLVLVLATLREAQQAKRDREAQVPLHEQPMADSPAAIARAEEDDLTTVVPAEVHAVTARFMGLEVTRSYDEVRVGTKGHPEVMQGLQAELEALPSVLRVEWTEDDAFALYVILRTGQTEEVGSEFAAEIDALVAQDLAADAPERNLVQTVVEAMPFRRPGPASARITTTRVPAVEVVLVQSGSKLVWGKLINVINRRTHYCPPLLATVEVNGRRRLIAADDLLVA